MRRPRMRDDRGAAAVEFAMIVPLFLMLVMGMITLAITFNRQLALTSAAREASRFGATLPTGKVAIPQSWFDDVAARALQSADGLLGSGVDGKFTCVAYVGFGSPQGAASDWTRKREQVGDNPPTYTSGALTNPASWCFDDGRGSNGNERRVQVVVRRNSDLNAVIYRMNIKMEARGVTRFEAVTP